MNVRQAFQMAIKSLLASKTRSFLTMLGIIIGVASVIILISLINGLSNDITSNLESAGTNTVTVNIMGRGGSNRAFSADKMDAFMAENPQHFTAYSPMVNTQLAAKNGTSQTSGTTVRGVGEAYGDIQSLDLSAGRFLQYIDIERLQKVCVIGTYIAEELFGGTVYADSTLKLNGLTFTVVGVLDETEDSTESSGDDVIYIPYTTATRLAGNATIGTWYLYAANVEEIDAAMTALRTELYEVFGNENAYRVMSMSQMIEVMNEITGSISLVLVGIAGISLVVGGIGIMNIMLVSVTERTREIGIRKALGARRRSIMSQFVIEAATTSAAGGVIGIILGVGLAFAAGSLIGMSVSPSLNAVLLAFGVSLAIGMIFGYFPAGKAANMNPVDALRYE